jgi:hypothetical protein
LNDNGVFFVEVPWLETADASPNNIFFRAHIFYFSVATLVASSSQYFDVVKVDCSSNLKILFRKKPAPEQMVLPDAVSVAELRSRLASKGWFEYLFAGRGILKPIEKVARFLEELKWRRMDAKAILDKLLEIRKT